MVRVAKCDKCDKKLHWFKSLNMVQLDGYNGGDYKRFDFCNKCFKKVHKLLEQFEKGD
jgi:hypothetical protein